MNKHIKEVQDILNQNSKTFQNSNYQLKNSKHTWNQKKYHQSLQHSPKNKSRIKLLSRKNSIITGDYENKENNQYLSNYNTQNKRNIIDNKTSSYSNKNDYLDQSKTNIIQKTNLNQYKQSLQNIVKNQKSTIKQQQEQEQTTNLQNRLIFNDEFQSSAQLDFNDLDEEFFKKSPKNQQKKQNSMFITGLNYSGKKILNQKNLNQYQQQEQAQLKNQITLDKQNQVQQKKKNQKNLSFQSFSTKNSSKKLCSFYGEMVKKIKTQSRKYSINETFVNNNDSYIQSIQDGSTQNTFNLNKDVNKINKNLQNNKNNKIQTSLGGKRPIFNKIQRSLSQFNTIGLENQQLDQYKKYQYSKNKNTIESINNQQQQNQNDSLQSYNVVGYENFHQKNSKFLNKQRRLSQNINSTEQTKDLYINKYQNRPQSTDKENNNFNNMSSAQIQNEEQISEIGDIKEEKINQNLKEQNKDKSNQNQVIKKEKIRQFAQKVTNNIPQIDPNLYITENQQSQISDNQQSQPIKNKTINKKIINKKKQPIKDYKKMNIERVKQVNKYQDYLKKGLEKEKALIAMQEKRIKDDNYLFLDMPYTKEAMKLMHNEVFTLKIDDGIIDYNLNNFRSSQRKDLPLKIDPKYQTNEISYDKQKKRKQIQEQFLTGQMNIEDNTAEFFENFDIQQVKSPKGIIARIKPDKIDDNLFMGQGQNSYSYLNQELKLGFSEKDLENLKNKEDKEEGNLDIFQQQVKLNMFQKNTAYVNYFKQVQKSTCENVYLYQKQLLNKKYNKNNLDNDPALSQNMELGFDKNIYKRQAPLLSFNQNIQQGKQLQKK